MNNTTELQARLRLMRGYYTGASGEIAKLAADALAAQDAEIAALRAELEKVNNEFGSQTADWPDAWKRVAQVKEDSGRHWRESQQFRAERDADKQQILDLMAEVVSLESARDAFKRAMYDEISADLHIREIGRALPDEDMPTFLERLIAERDAAVADAERLRIRGAAYEEAYRIAYQATYQPHNGHWDSTMQGGDGCRECIKAREARQACDEALRTGLESLVERAARTQPEQTP